MALFQVFLAVYKYSAWQNVSLWIWPTQIVDICSLADSTDASLFSVPLCVRGSTRFTNAIIVL